MQFEGFDKADLQQFSKVQNLAYECVEAVQAQLTTGMTEKDAVRLLREWLAARGVTHMFHDPFAWFGKRAAFKNFWINIKFLPSKARLKPGMPAILDVAPIVDGYSSDIGYCFVHGGDATVDKMDQVLMEVRDHIVQAVRQKKTMRAIYLEMDAIIESAGFINVHRYYPHRVLGHRMGRLDTGLLHRVRWLGFGLPTYVLLTSKTWLSKVFPKWIESPLWNTAANAITRCPGPVGGGSAHRHARPARGHQVGGTAGGDEGQRLLAEPRSHALPPRSGCRLVEHQRAQRAGCGRLKRRAAEHHLGGVGEDAVAFLPQRLVLVDPQRLLGGKLANRRVGPFAHWSMTPTYSG